MEPDKDKAPEAEEQKATLTDQAPADALSRTPEDLEQEQVATGTGPSDEPEKKVSPIKRFFRKVNVYFLIFGIIVVVVGVIAAVNYLNSIKPPVEPDVESQTLTEDALKQLANTDATIGDSSQTLNIQGNAVIAGSTLTRGSLNVASNLQTGGSIQGPSLTISGATNLNDTQINSLQVATNTAVQGTTTLRDLNVSGASSFSGPITASQLTVTRLIMSGNAILEVPNHISFTGATPGISSNAGVVGNGGSASVSGSDTTGTVLINTGNNPSNGCFARITFQQAFTNSPHVIISPIDEAAGQVRYYATRDRQGFSVCTTNGAPANKTFAFDFFVTN